ncbi:FtsQ-type POTRA domain-containing protein [Microbacterium sp. NPDC055903]
MRRPAPLPAEQAKPQREPARRASPAPRTADVQGEPEADIAVLDAPERAAVQPSDSQELTQRDVWRAARARRKALKSEIRRFTQRSRRRRIVWLSVLGALVLLVGGSAAAAYSPLFAVEKVTVVGASTLDPATVEAALSGQVGTPLALVDASEVKASLLAFPLIETYTLEASPPHGLIVRIVERTPVGVIRSDAGFTLVDAAGVVLSTTDAQPEGQPLLEIEGGADSSAFTSAGLVVRSLPAELRAQLTLVQAASADAVSLTLGGRTVVWGSAEDSALKALALQGLIAANPDADSFDVSAPGVGIVG